MKAVYDRFLEYYNVAEADAEREALPRNKFTNLIKRDYLEMTNYKQKKIAGKPVYCFFGIKLKPLVDPDERALVAQENKQEVKEQKEDVNPFE